MKPAFVSLLVCIVSFYLDYIKYLSRSTNDRYNFFDFLQLHADLDIMSDWPGGKIPLSKTETEEEIVQYLTIFNKWAEIIGGGKKFELNDKQRARFDSFKVNIAAIKRREWPKIRRFLEKIDPVIWNLAEVTIETEGLKSPKDSFQRRKAPCSRPGQLF